MALIARGCWIGFQKGFLVEIFKNVSIVVAIVVGFHYYVRCGNALIPVLQVFKPVAHIFSYIFLVGTTIFLFRMIREGLFVLFRDEEYKCTTSSKLMGMALGFLRSLLLSSIFLFGCLAVDRSGLTSTVRRSFTESMLLPIDAKIYSGAYHWIIDPLFQKEKKNMRVFMLVEGNKRVFD